MQIALIAHITWHSKHVLAFEQEINKIPAVKNGYRGKLIRTIEHSLELYRLAMVNIRVCVSEYMAYSIHIAQTHIVVLFP